MPTVRYTTINGEVIAEKRNGVRRLYVPDPLGSTVALLDNTQTQVDTATYWPYGEVRTVTGTTPVPFQFVGTLGYYSDGYLTEAVGRTYVRARYHHTVKGRWLTQDPIGFDGGWNPYTYAYSSPIVHNDPTGNQPPTLGPPVGLPPALTKCLTPLAQIDLLLRLANPQCARAIQGGCRKSAVYALLDPTIVPKWIFQQHCARPDWYGCTNTLGSNTPGAPCTPAFICITNSICQGDPATAACTVIWELGNACQCKNQGFYPHENIAQQFADACGCHDLIGPGGMANG